jgi:hypothetical protein
VTLSQRAHASGFVRDAEICVRDERRSERNLRWRIAEIVERIGHVEESDISRAKISKKKKFKLVSSLKK